MQEAESEKLLWRLFWSLLQKDRSLETFLPRISVVLNRLKVLTYSLLERIQTYSHIQTDPQFSWETDWFWLSNRSLNIPLQPNISRVFPVMYRWIVNLIHARETKSNHSFDASIISQYLTRENRTSRMNPFDNGKSAQGGHKCLLTVCSIETT